MMKRSVDRVGILGLMVFVLSIVCWDVRGEFRQEIVIEGDEAYAKDRCMIAARGRSMGFSQADETGQQWLCIVEGEAH